MPRDQFRSLRLTRDELALVQQAAAAAGLKISGFIADAAVAVARTQGQGTLRAGLLDQRGQVEELMEASAQLARVGNNLNQIARVLNSGGHVGYVEEAMARVLRAVARVEVAATELAKR
ncbi:plasmid mobilization protein [Streptomyces sp. Da 82-17]|uniref:plasmid mobilization protein n=1 Tax=Streptomyces sp. Da 82-17 TaxID=3377116 RepID=UPI0038D35B10